MYYAASLPPADLSDGSMVLLSMFEKRQEDFTKKLIRKTNFPTRHSHIGRRLSTVRASGACSRPALDSLALAQRIKACEDRCRGYGRLRRLGH